MNQHLDLHLVGGFLGSGKTTAIINAAKGLMAEGRRVGVITNDQGKYLVDTAFFRLEAIPALEVTGGCFCCNYDDLNGRLAQLIASAQPEIIFAESVGSCADIVATVVKPLLELGGDGVKPSSFSVFTDARMLRRRLLGQEMPFNDDIIYIFDKQIEEAGLLVVNKVDLVSAQVREEIQDRLAERYPDKACLFQNALAPGGVLPWLERIQRSGLELANTNREGSGLEIDYTRYGAGEALLAWVDEEVKLWLPPDQGRAALQQMIRQMLGAIGARGAGIGHLKFIVSAGDSGTAGYGGVKLSFTSTADEKDLDQIPEIQGGEGGVVTLLINARVEMPAEALRGLFRKVLEESGVRFAVRSEAAFHPAQPNPTHRL